MPPVIRDLNERRRGTEKTGIDGAHLIGSGFGGGNRAIDDIKSAALDMEILPEPRRNVETAIRTLLKAFKLEDVVFDYSS